jgi:hypothetical protein
MPLDDRHQAFFDVFCHVYSIWLDYFDELDDAVFSHPDWNGYALVGKCLDPAAQKFGTLPADSIDPAVLCNDFLNRIVGSFTSEFPDTSPVLPVLESFREAVTSTELRSPADIDWFHDIGERLSAERYLTVCPPDSPCLCRQTEYTINPSNRHEIRCRPAEDEGISVIIIGFCTSDFTLERFLNLPFFFLHEYLSHIHSAELFAEGLRLSAASVCSETPPPFEDGWLLYAAHRFYAQQLLHDLTSSLSHTHHREYYVGKYIYRLTGDTTSKMVEFGYRQAQSFEDIVGSDLFWNVTLQLATRPFDHISGCPDLHGEFMMHIKPWIRWMHSLAEEERNEHVELISLAMEDAEPIGCLLDILR